MFANEALVKINGINYVMNQKEIFDITTKIVCKERKKLTSCRRLCKEGCPIIIYYLFTSHYYIVC